MKEVYSHSKLWLYENCPESYKIKYIDKTFPDLPSSIHAFLGSIVHETLEFLYTKIQQRTTPTLDEVIEYFAKNWHAHYTFDIRVPSGQHVQSFFNKGIKFLIDYYQKNAPFQDNTLHLEKKILFQIGTYKITGFIDRIVKVGHSHYEVHDYKTNESMKTQEQVDTDRQLAFYHLGLQELFGSQIKVNLIWHFLAHNKKISSSRTPEQLQKLKDDTLALIKKIESTTDWPSCGKMFCDWCSYKRIYGTTIIPAKTPKMKGTLHEWI